MSDFFSSYEQGIFPLLRELLKSWGTSRSQAAINKYRDYNSARIDNDRLKFQQSLYQILQDSHSLWESYDYGAGYYYQGLKALGITGFRDTDARIDSMDLKKLVAGKSVLEIGCNTGFLSLGIADSATKVVGMDINPYIIKVAQESAKYLDLDNVEFSAVTFEDFLPEETFDCVLSFANHSTYDGNTKHSLTDYFKQCSEILDNNGLFVFESHPPIIEKDTFERTVKIIKQYFTISHRESLKYGNHMDSVRTFIVGNKR